MTFIYDFTKIKVFCLLNKSIMFIIFKLIFYLYISNLLIIYFNQSNIF